MSIIIKTPQPDTEERLVLVPEGVPPRDGRPAYRDATPDDLARGGYVRDGDLLALTIRAEKAEGLLIQRETELRLAREDGAAVERQMREARSAADASFVRANQADMRAEKAEKRAEKAERLRAECESVLTAMGDRAREAEQGRDSAIAHADAIDEKAKAFERDWHAAKHEFGEATSKLREQLREAITRAEKAEAERRGALACPVHDCHDVVRDLRKRAERAEERVASAYDMLKAHDNYGSADLSVCVREVLRVIIDKDQAIDQAERERDEALGRAQSETEWRVRAVSERQDAEVERDTLRAELARLTLVDEEEPTVSWFYDTYCARPESTQQEDCADAYRLGVAHERARQQPAKDRATDGELCAAFDSVPGPACGANVIDKLRAVAARVRQERCLVAQAVARGWYIYLCPQKNDPSKWDIETGRVIAGRSDGGAILHGVPASDVPATLARLLGEVSR